jgi:hypothetical protein
MTIIHFLLSLPKWSFGLFLFLASYTNPLPETQFAFSEPIARLGTLVQMEAASYQDCVQRTARKMGKQLEETAKQDQQVLQEIHDSNRLHIQNAQGIMVTCLANTQKARQSLMQWEKDGMTLPWAVPANASSEICTPHRRNQTAQFLGQNFQRYDDQASDAMESYVDDSQSSLGRMHAYAQERFAYDLQYFVMDRVQPALDYLAEQTARIQTVAITFELDLFLLEGKFRHTLLRLETLLEKAKHHIDVLQEKLEDFKVSIVAFHAGYGDLYHRLELTIDFATELLPPGANLPDFLDLSKLHIAEFYLPNTALHWPKLDLDYRAIHDLLDETAQECMVIIMEILETVQAQANQQLRHAMQELANALMNILELKGYNPPTFQGSQDDIGNLDEELDYQSQRGKETQKWVKQALANLRLQEWNVENDDVSIPELPKANYSYVQNETSFEYLAMLLPNINIPELLADLVVWILANTWVLEVAIQFYRLYRLEAVYAMGAIPNLPEINYGDIEDDSGAYQTKYLIMMMIVKCLLRPHLFIIALLCLPIGVVTVGFWFPHVHQSCVVTTEGTFLARNILSPLLINQANAFGNAQYLSTKFSCQQSQRHLCTDIAAQAEARHQTDWTAFHSVHAQHNQSLEALSLLKDCLEVDTMTELMNEACCGLKGYNTTGCLFPGDMICPIDSTTTPPSAYLHLETYLSDFSCQQDFHWSLSNAQYSCEGLVEVCEQIPCAGVNKDLIRSHSIETDCKAELYAIQFSYFLMATILHAIVINVVCTLLLNGIQRLYWRKLNPCGFIFKTTIREDGTLANGTELEERSQKVALTVQRFETVTKIQFGMGIAVLFAYVIVASVLISKN